MKITIALDEPWINPELQQSPAGMEVEYKGNFHEGEGARSTVFAIIVSIPIGFSTSLAASWVYDLLNQHHTKRILIDRQEIRVEKGEIERIFNERIEVDE